MKQMDLVEDVKQWLGVDTDPVETFMCSDCAGRFTKPKSNLEDDPTTDLQCPNCGSGDVHVSD